MSGPAYRAMRAIQTGAAVIVLGYLGWAFGWRGWPLLAPLFEGGL